MTTLKVQKVAKAKGYNIGKLSRESQLDIRLVRRYWHNQIRSISLDALDAIAAVLQVSSLELLDVDGKLPENPSELSEDEG